MKTTTNNFGEFIKNQAVLQNLNKLGYVTPTPIQSATLGHIINGLDVRAKAKTGSGKTAAFGLPILLGLNENLFKPSALILTPTRELAEQVANELRNLASFRANVKILTLCGGTRFAPQVLSLEHGSSVLVGTPGRVWQHLCEGKLRLDSIKTLVLDEADRMLEMGFSEDVLRIVNKTPKERQALLFSATFPKEVDKLCDELLNEALHIEIEDDENKAIKQEIYEVEESLKNETLRELLLFLQPSSAIVFCKTKIGVAELQRYLWDEGFDALSLHGDLEQFQRDENLLEFTHASVNILVATDVASRGLDIKDVALVVNFDIPNSLEVYTHRIGRTGRMGKEGLAVSFVTPNESFFIKDLQKEGVLFSLKSLDEIEAKGSPKQAEFTTLCIDAGKKQKMRNVDILGTLTKGLGLDASMVGKITIAEKYSYVAIKKEVASRAFEGLNKTTIKGRFFRVWQL